VVRLHVGGDFLCGSPHKKSCVTLLVMWRKSPSLVAFPIQCPSEDHTTPLAQPHPSGRIEHV
jgi:hypothetical protein